jgi:hypothetical protein
MRALIEPNPGNPVTVGDVVRYARKDGCSSCRASPAGVGVLVISPPALKARFAERKDDGTIIQGEKIVPSQRHVCACSCAVRRFIKVHGKQVEPIPGKPEGIFRWKPAELVTPELAPNPVVFSEPASAFSTP